VGNVDKILTGIWKAPKRKNGTLSPDPTPSRCRPHRRTPSQILRGAKLLGCGSVRRSASESPAPPRCSFRYAVLSKSSLSAFGLYQLPFIFLLRSTSPEGVREGARAKVSLIHPDCHFQTVGVDWDFRPDRSTAGPARRSVGRSATQGGGAACTRNQHTQHGSRDSSPAACPYRL